MKIPVIGARPRMVVTREKKRHPPVEIADGVALWGRKHNRSARLRWYNAPMNCWAVMLGYKEGDPRREDGTKDEPVFLHEWKSAEWWTQHEPLRAPRKMYATGRTRIRGGYRAFDLDELGLEGIIRILDGGDILSARGEFDSVMDAGNKIEQKFRTEKHRRRLFLRDEAGHRARDHYKFHHQIKIPYTNLAIRFGKGGT